MSKIVSKILPKIFGKDFFFYYIFASLLSLQVSPASAARAVGKALRVPVNPSRHRCRYRR